MPPPRKNCHFRCGSPAAHAIRVLQATFSASRKSLLCLLGNGAATCCTRSSAEDRLSTAGSRSIEPDSPHAEPDSNRRNRPIRLTPTRPRKAADCHGVLVPRRSQTIPHAAGADAGHAAGRSDSRRASRHAVIVSHPQFLRAAVSGSVPVFRRPPTELLHPDMDPERRNRPTRFTPTIEFIEVFPARPPLGPPYLATVGRRPVTRVQYRAAAHSPDS